MSVTVSGCLVALSAAFAGTVMLHHAKSGRVSALAYSAAKRWSGMPDLPRMTK